MTKIILLLIVTLLICFLISVLVAIMTNYPNYKYYKKIYNNLDKMRFVKTSHQTQIWGANQDEHNFPWDSSFVYFVDSKSIKLTEDVYIHGNLNIFMDPYAFYWHRKYVKHFKRRIKSIPFVN